MEFNKELAKKIIEDNKLSKRLLAIWRKQGIPSCYLQQFENEKEENPDVLRKGHPQELLKSVVNKRKWHNGLWKPNVASVYKKLIQNDEISYEKTCEILSKLGYKEVQQPLWAKEK